MLDWETLIARSELTCPLGGWKPSLVAAAIDATLDGATRPVKRETIGHSFEGRPIEMVTLGDGPTRVLMWSQMHGDEPTHTSVLLNLLKMLVSEDNPAERLLRGLTLGMILPLNPDGAERNTRQNAQGIDVNRDALEFATPEGRAFRGVIESFKPAFGFNLHNQHYRTSIGSPPQPAAVSLLVPPLDPADTQTESVQQAVRVAATFHERVRDAALGRVSRYNADFMARAFGEWVQRQGVSVILIEAGGWPDRDFVFLEKIHFAAFAQTLDAIAASALNERGGLEECDPNGYHRLQRSSPYHLFDLLVASGGVAQLRGESDECFLAPIEVGIDYPHRMAGWYEFRNGRFAALGDLHENGGISTVETDAILLPGRIVLADAPAEVFEKNAADWAALAAVGASTALVPINLADEGFDALVVQALYDNPPMNAALVGTWDGPEPDVATVLQRLTIAIEAGVVALIGKLPAQLATAAGRIGLPTRGDRDLPRHTDPMPATLDAWLVETRRVANAIGMSGRGQIGLHGPADFVLVDSPDGAVEGDCLKSVYVGGTVVHESGELSRDWPGRWLKRSDVVA